MNLKFTNAQWNNAKKTSFTLDVQDLDKEFLNGEVFPFTYIVDSKDDSPITLEVKKTFNENLLEIAEYVAPIIPIEEVRQAKLSELANKAQAFEQNVNKEMYFTSSVYVEETNDETNETVKKYLVINGDRRTRSNLQDLIAYQPTDNVIYRDYDNQERTLTKEQLQVILKEHVVNGEAIYHQKWEYEAKINACTTIEELNAIEIKFIMHDFSKEEVVADE